MKQARLRKGGLRKKPAGCPLQKGPTRGYFDALTHATFGTKTRAGEPRKVFTSVSLPGATETFDGSGFTSVVTMHSAGASQRFRRWTMWLYP